MNDPDNIPAMLNESNQAHATAYGALIIALIDKGVITQEEYDRAYIQAQHDLSQEFARKRDSGRKEEIDISMLWKGPDDE